MPKGFTAIKHQREVGTSYFDAVTTTIRAARRRRRRSRTPPRTSSSSKSRRRAAGRQRLNDGILSCYDRAAREGRAVFSPGLARGMPESDNPWTKGIARNRDAPCVLRAVAGRGGGRIHGRGGADIVRRAGGRAPRGG
jgi:hypothetical protein